MFNPLPQNIPKTQLDYSHIALKKPLHSFQLRINLLHTLALPERQTGQEVYSYPVFQGKSPQD